MKSTSFININGDKKQNKFSLLSYLFLNLIQNIYLSLFKRKFKYLKFKNRYKFFKFNNKHSISRKLCSLFWKNINWKYIVNIIGNLDIHELGPGDGNYFKKEISINNNFIKKYNGFDVNLHKKWKLTKSKKLKFKQFNGYDFKKILNKQNNLFISQSCLEHVRYDLKYFKDIKDISRKSKKKIILIHCLPNFFCLFTYLAHGFRQYNTENINKISTVLGNGNTFVVKLGNLKLNYDHLKKTTLPLIFKKKDLMQNQSKSNYKKINNEILEMKKSFIPFSSFVVLISVINFSETEKKDLLSNFFSIS
mgnify:FL=1|tara:strand:+ start:1216 stop:2133 length:918 start_codon:yes stop_codon:yes gene_type:complete